MRENPKGMTTVFKDDAGGYRIMNNTVRTFFGPICLPKFGIFGKKALSGCPSVTLANQILRPYAGPVKTRPQRLRAFTLVRL